MKKILLTFAFLGASSLFANAQFNASAGLTYTRYASDIKKATPGIHLRGSYYFAEKYAGGLGLSYGLPIKTTYNDGTYNFERTSSFMAISALATLHLIGTYEDDFSLYFPIGVSYLIGNSKYSIDTETTSDVATEKEKLSGLTVNLNVGMQYRIGAPYIFAEAGFGLAANNTSNTRTGVTGDNPAPGHTVLQLGIRIPFGGGY